MNGQRILGDTIKYPAKSFPGFFFGGKQLSQTADEHG